MFKKKRKKGNPLLKMKTHKNTQAIVLKYGNVVPENQLNQSTKKYMIE